MPRSMGKGIRGLSLPGPTLLLFVSMFKGLRVANSSRECSMLRSERARERCRLSVVRYPYAYRDAEDGVGDGPVAV